MNNIIGRKIETDIGLCKYKGEITIQNGEFYTICVKWIDETPIDYPHYITCHRRQVKRTEFELPNFTKKVKCVRKKIKL